MPLTLNTSHPLYSSIVAFICVDDDNVVKDLKGDTCTTDAAVVIGTGTYGRHFRTTIVSNNAKGIALTSGHLTKPVANPVGTSMIVINTGNSRASRGSVTNTPNGAVNSIGVYTGDAAGCQTSNNYPVALGTTDVIGTGSHCIAAAWNGSTEYKTWVNGNQEAVVSGNLGNATDTGKTTYIGGPSTGGFGGFAADYVYYIHFRKYLSEAELDEIYTSLGANNQISLLNSGGSDVDPPTFTVAPAASAIGQTSATVTATINETGSIFWVAVPQGDATPSVAQVIAGQNAAGSAPIDAGSAVATTSLSEVASGFTAATDYKFCVVARDDETTPNVQAAVTVVNFTTAAAGDTTPPVFTVAPAVTSVSQTTATVSATIDETGSIFWVVVPNAESTPSVAQVIAGQNAAGGTPTDAGSAVGTTTLSEGVAGMTASTAYKACFVARDDEAVPNVQATVTTVGFTTAAVPVGTITITDVVNNTNTPWTSAAVDAATVMPLSLSSIVVSKTGLSTTAGADLVITDAAIVTGTEYIIILKIGTAYGWYRAVST